MHHLILGYGYCGYYLAQELLRHGARVTTVSRHVAAEMQLAEATHLYHDLTQPFEWLESDSIIYYLIPPQATGEHDLMLKQLLDNSNIKCRKVVYFGSSGVYGQHQGAWVNEHSPCIITHERQKRRLDAEQQWQDYCVAHHSELAILRIAGIYGPNRLPIDAAKAQTPVIIDAQAPYTNPIYVDDLAAVAYLLGQKTTEQSIYNIADGQPQPMGTLQKLLAAASALPPAPSERFEQAWSRASAMKREFMASSKRLVIDRLLETLGDSFSLTPLNKGLYLSLTNDKQSKTFT